MKVQCPKEEGQEMTPLAIFKGTCSLVLAEWPVNKGSSTYYSIIFQGIYVPHGLLGPKYGGICKLSFLYATQLLSSRISDSLRCPREV